MYHVDKGLGVVLGEVFGSCDRVIVQEDRPDQRVVLVWCESVAGQTVENRQGENLQDYL